MEEEPDLKKKKKKLRSNTEVGRNQEMMGSQKVKEEIFSRKKVWSNAAPMRELKYETEPLVFPIRSLSCPGGSCVTAELGKQRPKDGARK